MKEYNVQGTNFRFHLFDRITSPEEAYLIGYLAGDGGFVAGTYKRKARLNVSSGDKSTIEFISKTFCPDTAIKKIWPMNNQRDIVATQYSYGINFSSTMSAVFAKFGILSLKRDRVCINIPDRFMVDYIRGLFDADGHITYGYRKDRNRLVGRIGFTHQSFKLLETVQNFLEKHGVSSSIKQRNDENCIDLKFSKIDSIYTFIDLLYPSEYYCLDRKMEKCMEFRYLPKYKK